ncbi:MAG: DNA topoisomerase, partial [Solirubrobacterales bacterium]
MMEELGLGTKATRPDIIQKLYSRGYVYNNPPEPSETGIAMYKAFHDHVVRMATPEMTAELEKDMDEIAAGESSKDEVIKISRDMLHQTYDDLFERREDLAKTIWAGMDEDKFIGTCEVCEEKGRTVHEDGSPNRLRIIDLKGGKRFWGCEGYNRDDPEHADSCGNSGPLPGRGYELWRLEPKCSICGVRPRLTVKGFRGRPWKLCLNDDCPSMVEMREKREERRKAKEEAEKRKAAKGGGEDDKNGGAAAKKAEPKPKKGGGARKKPPSTTTRTKRATGGKKPTARTRS